MKADMMIKVINE